MQEKEKVKNISKAGLFITNTVETFAFKTAEIIGLLTIQISALDLGLDGNIDIFYNNPTKYTAALLSPIAVGYLIKKIDPNNETAKEIDEIIEDFKPKAKVRKK